MDPDGVQPLAIEEEGAPPQGGLLKQRHVQMIAIAGTLGTGLFLGSGEALRGAGPLGALIAYAVVSTVTFASLCSVGEMTSCAPISGTFPHYASRWVDEALGFAVGWNYFYTNAITVPVEISGAQLLISYWDSNPDHQWIYLALMCASTCIINLFGARWFGEAEFVFSFMKLTMITILIVIGLVIDLGGGPNHDRIGFRYWKNPGPFARADLVSNQDADRFLGFLSVIVQAAFSFQGMEIAAIAAAVTESPRRNIAKAIRKSFYRIVIFYIVGIFIAGLIVPSDDPDLLAPSDSTAKVTESPFVIAMRHAGIKTVAGVVNAGLVTSAFSAGNSFLFAASRVLEALADRDQAPSIFKQKYNGTPIPAILFTSAFGLLSFMSLRHGAQTAFQSVFTMYLDFIYPTNHLDSWFVSLSTVGDFLSWATINLTYLYFHQGLKHHNIDRKKFIYWSAFQPWLSIWGLTMCILFTLISGFQVFWHFKSQESTFFTSYINVPLFFCLYGYWKITRKTTFKSAAQRDYTTGIPSIAETERAHREPHGFWEKVADILF
ncbi:general amino acid permease 1 [Paxillus ammoniavirescens]|nr:general amino acid permease 1 [Paxillus ammoniavirescens]